MGHILCMKCGAKNPDYANFCQECGEKIDNRPEWVIKQEIEKEKEKQGFFKITSTSNWSGYPFEIIMRNNGIETTDNQFIKYKDIISIQEKTKLSTGNTLFYGLSSYAVEIQFRGGQIVAKDIEKKEALKFIKAVREKILGYNSPD